MQCSLFVIVHSLPIIFYHNIQIIHVDYSLFVFPFRSIENKCTTLENLRPDVHNWFVKVFVSEKTPIRFLKWGRQQKLV